MPLRVSGLRVFSDEIGNAQGEELFEELFVGSNRYNAVESIIDLGVRVLETFEGRESLVDVATKTVEKRKEKRKQHLYGERPFAEMPMWIDNFLTKLRGGFPHVYLEKIGGEGMTTKYDWGDSMVDYDPKMAAELHLNRTILNNMIYADAQNDSNNYNLFKFQMAITVAHEIVHLLTGYLTGKKLPPTPPGVSLPSYGNTNSGESGRYWESQLLGGVVEFYEDKQDALGNKQSGIPYLMDDGRGSAPARLVSIDYVNEFLNSNFSFPIRTTGECTTRSELRRTSKETSSLRKGKNATMNTSPRRGNSSLAGESHPAASTWSEDGGCGGETYDMRSGEASEAYWKWDERWGYYHTDDNGTTTLANQGEASQSGSRDGF